MPSQDVQFLILAILVQAQSMFVTNSENTECD